jgi:hypothetical protein
LIRLYLKNPVRAVHPSTASVRAEPFDCGRSC